MWVARTNQAQRVTRSTFLPWELKPAGVAVTADCTTSLKGAACRI